MAERYFLRRDTDGKYSIMDIYSVRAAIDAQRALTRIPPDMAVLGLFLLNCLDQTERLENMKAVLSDQMRD